MSKDLEINIGPFSPDFIHNKTRKDCNPPLVKD